jgi:hypothetical protein
MKFNTPQIGKIYDKLRVLLNMEKKIIFPAHGRNIQNNWIYGVNFFGGGKSI